MDKKLKLKIAAGIPVVVFCILSGCEKKEQDDLLLPVYESSVDGAESAWEEETVSAGRTEEEETAPASAEAGTGLTAGQDKACVVHICGAVKQPGVYTMDAESRIYQAVEKAGGFRQDAAEDYLNQADMLADGMKIYVPTKEEVEEAGAEGSRINADGNGSLKVTSGVLSEGSALVNINTAGEELLCTLPGVGSSKAKSIISYREKNGAFHKIEDIMNVEGIKDGLFRKIKDSITV